MTMNITELRKEYDSLIIIRHDHKTKYIDCIKYYKSDCDVEKLIDGVKYGEVRIESDRVMVRVRI